MPDEILTPDDDIRPVPGLFGKMPGTGDFVWRGLPATFRKHWDSWITRHIAPMRRTGLALPAGGLRFRIPSGGRVAAGVILDSHDSVARRFPLSLLLIAGKELAPAQIDPWCDLATALQPEYLTPDELWVALEALPAPMPQGIPATSAQFWTAAHPPITTNPFDPDAALRTLLSA